MCQRQAGALAVGTQHFGGAVILPALSKACDAGLECSEIEVARSRCAGAHEVMDARLRAVGQHRRELNRLPIKGCHQLIADFDTQLGIEAVPGDKDEGRRKAAKRVAAYKQPRALAFLQPQNANGMLGQRGGIDLEQFVARIGVQNRLQGLRSMAVRHHPGGVHDCRHATANLRYFGDGSQVGGSGVQAQKARLADDVACFVKPLDGDVVQPGRAMYGGAGHGFCDQYQFVRFQQCQGFRWQACLRRLHGTAQDAQTSLWTGHQ